jgi:two-component system cell cycle sensor histidine kinase PleC
VTAEPIGSKARSRPIRPRGRTTEARPDPAPDPAGAGILVLSPEGTRLLRANAAAAAMLGYARDELLALQPGRLLAGPTDQIGWQAKSGTVALRRRDGGTLPCRVETGTLELDEGPRLMVALHPTGDGEERDRLDALLRVAIDALPEALVIYDTDDRLLYFNRAYREFYPYMPPFERLAGKHFFEVIRHSMEAPGVVRDPLCFADPAAYMQKRLERLHAACGEPFEQETSGRWHQVCEQRVPGVGFVGVRHDITEMKRLQTATERANGMLAEAREQADEARLRAENASRSKSEFLAMMSHELRTPLNAILGFSSLLAEQYMGPLGNEKYRDYAQSINESGTHLLSIINDILDLAKVEAGKMEIEPEPLDAARLAEECLSLMRGLADSRRLVLAAEVPAGLTVHADRRAAKQMVVNLLSNACKFTPQGGRVRLFAAAARDGAVRLGVADTGIGMTRDEIAVALEPFGQVGEVSTSARQGTGLGLPLVRSFVELHGGRLEIDSAPGVGTTVTLVFPPARA